MSARVRTVADLKRLPVGTLLRLVHCLMGPVPEGRQGRRVARVKSNALVLEIMDGPKAGTESWLALPKAADLRETATGFEVLEDGEVAASYEFVVVVRTPGPLEGRSIDSLRKLVAS